MAAGISSGGQIQELIALARRRVWQVVLPAVLTGSLGVMAGSLLPAKYTAETTMELGVIPEPLVDAGLDHNRLRDRMRAAEYVLKTYSGMDAVLQGLEWEHYDVLPPDERREFVRKLVKDLWIKIDNLEGTGVVFMTFGYRDTDPQRAAQLANHIRDYFIDDLLREVTETAKVELDHLNKDYLAADEEYEVASSRLTDLKKEHGISPTQSFGSEGRDRESDPIFVELQSRRAELALLEQALESAEVERKQLELRRESLPAVVNESATEIGGVELNDAIAAARTKINDARISQSNLRPMHSKWKRAQSDIEDLETQIAMLEGRSSDPRRIVNTKPNPELLEVAKKLEELDLTLKQTEAKKAVLERAIPDLELRLDNRIQVYADFQRLSTALDLVMLRRKGFYASREIQRQLVDRLSLPDFSPFEINQVALPPVKPSSPSALIIVAGSLVLGLAMGVLYALVAEFGRNGFRGPSDLGRSLPAPVLGAINEIVTVDDRRQRAFRAGLVGAATLILAASVLWVTWAFHSRPGLLGPELTSWLDEMRGQLR